jgi:hypothetical protein
MAIMRCLKTATVALATLGLVALTGSAQAQTTLYVSRSTFVAAFPDLPTETFEAGIINAGGITPMGVIALDKTTNNGEFSTGSILDGLRLTTASGTTSGLNIAGGSFPLSSGDGTKTIVINAGGDPLNMALYNGNAHDVGFDLGGNSGNLYTVKAFNGVTLLRTDTFPTVAHTFQFVGYSSASVPITSVSITSPGFTTIDNITFGAATPEPGAFSLLAGLGMCGIGLTLRVRRSRTARP